MFCGMLLNYHEINLIQYLCDISGNYNNISRKWYITMFGESGPEFSRNPLLGNLGAQSIKGLQIGVWVKSF